MNDIRSTLKEKERKLTRYLETNTTEEIINEMQECNPSLRIQSDILYRLKQTMLTQPVLNTIIFYVFATNKHKLLKDNLLFLGDLCKKFNIKSAQAAITLFKQYYAFNRYINQMRLKSVMI